MGLDCYYIHTIDEPREEVSMDNYFRGSMYRELAASVSTKGLYPLSNWIGNDQLIILALKISRLVIYKPGQFKSMYPNKQVRRGVKEWVAWMIDRALNGYGLYCCY